MFARIASLALTLAVLTACGREPQETPRTSPATGESSQSADQAGAGDRTRTQQTQPPGAGQPAEGGQHYERGATGAGVRAHSEGMTEEERQAALRACERLEAAERERCVNEVREQSNPDPMRRDRQE